jgi:mono/diheme cytochrome c family protein
MKTLAMVLSLLLIGISVPAWAQGNAANGKALVESKKCALCHKADSKLGKPLEQLGGDTDAKIKAALLDPKKTLGPQVKMPAYKLTDAEVADIIAYLKSCGK